MVDHTKLVKWYLDNVELLNLKATSITGTQEWLPGYYDYHIDINIGGKSFSGRGLGNTEELAFLKACSEAAERAIIILADLPIISGAAAHADQKSAMLNAKLELLERDAFLCHFLTRIPFGREVTAFKISRTSLANLTEKLNQHGIRLKLHEMGYWSNVSPFICIAFGENFSLPFGCIIGMGCKVNPDEAIEQALLECLRTVIGLTYGKKLNLDSISPQDFMHISNPSPLDHMKVSHHSATTAKLLQLCEDSPKDIKNKQAFDLNRISYTPIQFRPKELEDAPLSIGYATSPDLQSMYTGLVASEKINLKRLSEFCGRPLRLDDLERCPHPIG